MTTAKPISKAPLYAVIDLGSNSFHMLITRMVANSSQTVDKVKRKVRLASGLDKNNVLNQEAIARGLECLSFFAERLQDIPAENISIVATATLRIATNADEFLQKAEKVLSHKISLLSGHQEAENIYLGVAHTHAEQNRKLVLDIGGASTELIIGEGYSPLKVTSLDMGCVTFKQQFFPNGVISEKNFDNAVEAAKAILAPVIPDYQSLGWEQVYGGSGTMQALAELLNYQGKAGIIEYAYLGELKDKLLQFDHIDDIDIPGLNKERTPVIISGLAILTALYQSLDIDTLSIACGALREGILYEMLPDTHTIDIRERTINSLLAKFHIDSAHASRVKTLTSFIYQQIQPNWQFDNPNIYQLLTTSCLLHEIGLILEFKNHPKHGAYIIEQADLPGFSIEEKQLVAALIASQKQVINTEYVAIQKLVSKQEFIYLATIMRLAILLSGRRKDDVLPSFEVVAEPNRLKLVFKSSWLKQHPLIFDELQQESEYLSQFNMTLLITAAE